MTLRNPSKREQRDAIAEAMRAVSTAAELIGHAGSYFDSATGSAVSDVAEDELARVMGRLGVGGPVALVLAGIVVRYVDAEDVVAYTVGQIAALLEDGIASS